MHKTRVATVNTLMLTGKVFRIGTVRYNWPMSAHASQVFSIAHCTDSEDLPLTALFRAGTNHYRIPQRGIGVKGQSTSYKCKR